MRSNSELKESASGTTRIHLKWVNSFILREWKQNR